MELNAYTNINNRSVFTDALAPPTSKPAPKPWDRAPVSAHAPRLAGQKIWKKAGLRSASSASNQNKENEALAEVELLKGGSGMRKRARVVGEKRSGMMGEVGWLVKGVSPQKKGLEVVERESPKGGRTARKRTNADLVITPRKGKREVGGSPAKRVPLNDLNSPVKAQDAEKPRRRKSLRRSSRRLTIAVEEERRGSDVRVFTGGVDVVLPPIAPMDTPEEATTEAAAQSRADVEEEAVTVDCQSAEPEAATNDDRTAVEPRAEEALEPEARNDIEVSFSPEPVTSETAERIEYAQDSTPEVMEELKAINEDGALSCDLPHNEQSIELVEDSEQLSSTTDTSLGEPMEDESASSKSLLQDEESAEPIDDSEPQHAPLLDEHSVNKTEESPQLPHDQPEIPDAPIQEQQKHSLVQELVHPPSNGESEAPKSLSSSPHRESTVLQSIEENTEPKTPLPSMIPVIPRSRKRTPQRRGTRRSTRVTRASSVQSDDQTWPEGSMPETMPVLSSVQSASPRKRSPRKQVRTNDQPMQELSTLLQTPIALRSNYMASPKKTSPAKDSSSSPQEVPIPHSVEVFQALPDGEPLEQVEENEATVVLDAGHDNENKTRPHFPQEDFRNADCENHEGEMQVISPTQNSDDPLEVAQEILPEPNEEILPTPTQPLLGSETGGTNHSRDDISVEEIYPEAQLELVADFDGRSNYSFTSADAELANAPLSFSEDHDVASPDLNSDDTSLDALEVLEPIPLSASAIESQHTNEPIDELPETSTPNPTTTELVEAISENAPQAIFDHDDTDMLRNFLTRVKANKAAKAEKASPKRKRSLPHSPLRIPLGDAEDGNLSPSSPKDKDEFDVSLPTGSPAKRRKRNEPMVDEDVTEPRSTRRSARTRLPVKATTAPPSLIPLRRLGQEGGDNTITVRRTEEKELAALTRVNTRKNKGGASSPADVLAKKAEEKDDPASRQRALKEVFDEKEKRHGKSKKAKTVVWAEELAQYQTADGKKVVVDNKQPAEPEKEKETVPNDEKKKSSVPRVGHRSSKIALGMAANGTPAPKRKRGGRS